MSEPIDLDRITNYCNLATPGPWESSRWHIFAYPRGPNSVEVIGFTATNNASRTFQAQDNTDFIAQARADLPAVVEECKRLRAEVERLNSELDDAHADIDGG